MSDNPDGPCPRCGHIIEPDTRIHQLEEALKECVVALTSAGNKSSYEPSLFPGSIVMIMKTALTKVKAVLEGKS